jgi:hypothetical protein
MQNEKGSYKLFSGLIAVEMERDIADVGAV